MAAKDEQAPGWARKWQPVLTLLVAALALIAFLRPSIQSWWGEAKADPAVVSPERIQEIASEVQRCKERQDRIERVLDWQLTVLYLLAQKADLKVPPPPFSMRGGGHANRGEER